MGVCICVHVCAPIHVHAKLKSVLSGSSNRKLCANSPLRPVGQGSVHSQPSHSLTQQDEDEENGDADQRLNLPRGVSGVHSRRFFGRGRGGCGRGKTCSGIVV